MSHKQFLPSLHLSIPPSLYRLFITTAFVVALSLLPARNTAAGQVPPGFRDTVLVNGLTLPTACEFAPDGRLFILEKQGKVKIFKEGFLLKDPALALSVSQESERGLLGIAFDPEFGNNHFVYLYYTTAASNPKNRVSRFVVNGDRIDPATETILVDGIRSDAGNHNAGCLRFGNDGKLYISTGDGGSNSRLSQGLDNINGKILRINKDGSIPPDNPFVGQAGRRGEIWCYGLRNPWRFDFDRTNGKMLIADVGQNTWEEIDFGIRGANYGWPEAEGESSNPNFVNPIYVYNHDGGSASITGGIFYRGSTFPQEYQGVFFFGDYVLGFIRALKLTSSNTVESVQTFSPDTGQVVHFASGPDGALYSVILDGQIRRIQYGSGSNSVPVAKARASRRFGPLPLAVEFSAEQSFDPDGDPLRYVWQLGDGTSASGVRVSHTFVAPNNFTVRLTVTDSHEAGATATPLRIFAGDLAPIPVITKPAAGIIARPGQTVQFAGTASDPEDGALDATRLTWTVVLHHNDHMHPFLGPLDGVESGSFKIPVNDHVTGRVFFRIQLKAKDSRGLAITRFVDVQRQ